jgi:hypothetical protein
MNWSGCCAYDLVGLKHSSGEVLEIESDNHASVASNRSGQYVIIVGIGQLETVSNCLVSFN